MIKDKQFKITDIYFPIQYFFLTYGLGIAIISRFMNSTHMVNLLVSILKIIHLPFCMSGTGDKNAQSLFMEP